MIIIMLTIMIRGKITYTEFCAAGIGEGRYTQVAHADHIYIYTYMLCVYIYIYVYVYIHI